MTEDRRIQKGDIVRWHEDRDKEWRFYPHGSIKRVARDGSWADVEWTGIRWRHVRRHYNLSKLVRVYRPGGES